MIEKMKIEIEKLLRGVGVDSDIEFTAPPNPEFGDVAFACFGLAKAQKKNPVEAAKEITDAVKPLLKKRALVSDVKFAGPYVNFFVNSAAVAKLVLSEMQKKGKTYSTHTFGRHKRMMVEFGCPNPLKAFHLGHLKNLITGESVARLLEAATYEVIRVNYQGDVGMHVAKAMWAMQSHIADIRAHASESLSKRLALLGQIYAEGARAFEDDPELKKEIVAMNKLVYHKDPSIQELYNLTVGWSLEYFADIYERLGTRFDRLYMESEVSGPGEKIIRKYLKNGIFKESDGAIIYEGSKRGLHDRVFINSEGFPTYEAKDLGLSDAHFKEYHPDKVIHVVGKEQTEYFKVVINAIGTIWPKRIGKEFHLPGGFLQLKEGKMSSRTGNVIHGDTLLDQVKASVREVMHATREHERLVMRTPPAHEKQDHSSIDKDIDVIVEPVAIAAVKYAILKVHVSDDVAFDLETSVSLEGDSGPYLLYIVARIKSILRKSEILRPRRTKSEIPAAIDPAEKQLLLALSEYPEITKTAAEQLDPSVVAKYLFGLAQNFNTFYHACPVLQAEEDIRQFRLQVIASVLLVMENGLWLLGIDTVEEM